MTRGTTLLHRISMHFESLMQIYKQLQDTFIKGYLLSFHYPKLTLNTSFTTTSLLCLELIIYNKY